MNFDFPGKTLMYVGSQIEEINASLTEAEQDEFEELTQSHDLQYWQSLLEKNTDLIEDFLCKTPKQRNARLHTKYKGHWVEIHILALLAIKRTEAFVRQAQNCCLSDHYRELTAGFVRLDSRLQQAFREVDFCTDTW